MSEEASERDANITELPPSEEPRAGDKEPSFQGRLQLKDFMFDAGGPRRSSRLLRTSSQTPAAAAAAAAAVASSSGSATPAPEGAALPAPAPDTGRKRKAPTTTSSSSKASQRAKRDTGNDKDREKDEGEDVVSSPPRKKKTKRAQRTTTTTITTTTSSSYAPPSTYAHLTPLTDVITPGLLVLFIGLNPGVQTARSGHAYAHPSNLFWKLLHSSGLTPVPCRPEEDRTLPARFALGNTNIVARPSRNGAELSRAEMDAGVAVLDAKCRRWRPEAVCLVGKGIWESVFRVRRRRNLARGEFEYGWQRERMGAVSPDDDDDNDDNDDNEEDGEEGVEKGPWEGSRIFVATSTSGLAASLRLDEKERIWKILGDWCVQRRKERAEAEAEKEKEKEKADAS